MLEIKSNMLEQSLWNFPIPIHYGPGSINKVPSIAKKVGIKRPLIVSDSETAKLNFVNSAIIMLMSEDLTCFLFSDFSPNPTDKESLLGCEIFIREGCDGIIAIGGGSSLDIGKAIALSAYRSPDRFWDFDMLNEVQANKKFDRFAPLICVPTTTGTGAEVEPGAMITHTMSNEKKAFYHPEYWPLAAVLDPELALTLPKNLTAWTGIDAIVHAIEAYSVPNFHPICDGIALQALELICPTIKTAYRNGNDIEARGAMMVGSCLAAVSFTKGLGLVHSISHMVGGLYNTPHGLTNAVILPAVLRYNYPEIKGKVKYLARACGADSEDFQGLINWIEALYEEFMIPHSLGELGVLNQDIDKLVEMVVNDICFPTNPRPISKSQLNTFITDAINKTW
jgi:alcohol dehydrogenase class IV